jgi:hypothetical protein
MKALQPPDSLHLQAAQGCRSADLLFEEEQFVNV